MKADEQLELLRSCVRLRLEGRKVRESVRRELATVEGALATVIGPIVRKTVAAKLLGCSVQALDRHVAAGRLEVEPIADGANRMAVPRERLVAIAFEKELAGRSLTEAIEAADERRLREREFREISGLVEFSTRIGRLAREQGVA
jgi:hypothetical protein